MPQKPLNSTLVRLARTLSQAAAVGTLAACLVLRPDPLSAQEPSVVKRVELFATETGRAVWSPNGDQIAFERREPNGYTQLWVARADLSQERCLTCRLPHFKKVHAGNPTWHPSGEYLVVQVEDPVGSGGEPLRFMEVPGGNVGSDLFFVRADGRDAFNLTNLGERGGRVNSPRFSHEGGKLSWAERLSSGGGAFGKWALRLASLEVKRGIPRLKAIDTFKPGETLLFLDNHGFTTDDRGLLLTGNLEAAQAEGGMDVYRLDAASGSVKRLTDTDQQLDRFALQAPNGNWIAWTSSREIGSGQVTLERRETSAVRAADLWLMNAEGLSVQRLTRFNDVHSPTFAGKTMVVPTSWNRDGDKLLALALAVGSNAQGDLYLIELNEPIGR